MSVIQMETEKGYRKNGEKKNTYDAGSIAILRDWKR